MHTPQVLEVKPLDMRQFNPRNAYETVLKLQGTFNSERRNAIFKNYLDHVDYESVGVYDGLMATCSKKRQEYTVFFSPLGPKTGQPQSYEELEKHYYKLVESNTYLIHREVDKLIVGDDELFVDGVMHQLYPGKVLVDYGMDLDSKTVYQLTARVAIVFIFDADGMGCGEQAYADTQIFDKNNFTPVETDLVPEQFWNNPVTGKYEL